MNSGEIKLTALGFWEAFRGVEIRCNGRVICKAAAYELARLGRINKNGYKVTFTEKPGWKEGKLIRQKEYSKYLDSLIF